MQDLDTTNLQVLLTRIRAGDPQAREELIAKAQGRLERLARRMLRDFPTVRRWDETADVLQNALLRLLAAVEVVTPARTRDFLNLAAVQIRRELLDLARRYQNRPLPAPLADARPDELAQSDARGQAELDRWAAFHEAVERLPSEEREVVSLILYHGWSRTKVGELLQVDPRTVRRRWQSACVRLNETLEGGIPGA
jgi:RNA polymerase sigma-70 factor (ECF subfamily)